MSIATEASFLSELLNIKFNTSSIKQRIDTLGKIVLYLENELDNKEDDTAKKQDIAQITLKILESYTSYQDDETLSMVYKVFDKLLEKTDNKLLPKFLLFIDATIGKMGASSHCSSDFIVFLKWVIHFISSINVESADFDTTLIKALDVYMNITTSLDLSFPTENISKHQLKIRKHVLNITVRCFKQTNKSVNLIQKLDELKYIEKITSKGPIAGATTLIGALAAFAAIENAELKNEFEVLLMAKIVEFIGKQVLLGKPSVSATGLVCNLKSLFKYFLTQDHLDKNILPNLERAIMRSSDAGFAFAFSLFDSKLYEFIENGWDSVIKSKVLGQHFSSLKSSKDSTKQAAQLSLLKLVENGVFSKEASVKLITEIFKNLKTNLNSEYKHLVAKLLTSINFNKDLEVADFILTSLDSYISKETNEAVLGSLLEPYFKAANILDASLLNKHLPVIEKGITDNKLIFKKIWISGLLSSLNTSTSDDFKNIIIKNKDLKIFIKTHISSHTTSDHQLSLGSIQLLAELDEELQILSDEDKLHFGENVLKVIASKTLSYKQIENFKTFLTRLYVSNSTLLTECIVLALQKFLSCSKETVESDWNIVSKKLTSAFIIVSTPLQDKFNSASNLIKLLLFTKAPLINSNIEKLNGWAGLCLKAELDPSLVVAEHYNELIEQYNVVLSSINDSTQFYNSIFDSLAYTAFINPKAFGPVLAENINSGFDVDYDLMATFKEDDMKIFRDGEDGKLVIDVIAQLDQRRLDQMNKNSKEYENMVLEMEQRAKNEKLGKKIPPRQLTKDEQLKIDEQLDKEMHVRREITHLHSKILPSLRLINSLSKYTELADTAMEHWYSLSVEKLLTLLKIDSYNLLFGQEPLDVFLHLSSGLSSQLDTARLFIAVATCRAYKVKHIPHNLTEEPLLDLISRVLYKVKFLTNRTPFSGTSLTFILPLLTYVLIEGKKNAIKNSKMSHNSEDFVSEDKEEEHLLLALEIIATHGEQFQDSSIPRGPILENILSLLALPSKAKDAKECFNTLCQNISITPTEKDLKLILSKLMSPSVFVRSIILETLDEEFELNQFFNFVPEVYILLFDADDNVRELASQIWESNEFDITDEVYKTLIDNFFNLEDAGLRSFTAKSYASAGYVLSEKVKESLYLCVANLIDCYDVFARPLGDILDKNGFVITPAARRKDPWEVRSTVAIALIELVQFINADTPREEIVKIVSFFINSGALGDKNPDVREEFKDAGIAFLTTHGKENVESFIPIFEFSLANEQDLIIQENVIVLYGSLAQHLSADDSRVSSIVAKLLDALVSPSEDVHQAVAQIISPLVIKFRSNTGIFIGNLFNQLFDSQAPPFVRKGAAWGIAGLVKGYGISAMYEFDITRNLVDAIEDKKDPQRREAVAFCFQTLSKLLGKYFEPYVIEVLPYILKNLGDPAMEVRVATTDAAKTIMTATTGYGLQKMIPVAISNLNDISWRTKRGSVELLGSMAYLNPTQLSSSLSTIVPKIVGVLGDSHKEVRKSGDQALERFGEVIRNPEVQLLVPTLIKAIGDPTKYTEEALNALIKTQFVHYIDGPSLALIIHIIHRGMRERSANTKRLACKIVGNMAILVDSRDLIPYLSNLIEEVEVAMVDPVPNTRATAARALGALVERLGEEQFPGLIQKLLATLADTTKTGDRLGSAQALAEIISGLGLSKLDEMLPTILEGVNNSNSYTREGFAPLLLFIPVCFGSQFAPYINQIIKPILQGLADLNDSIRETSMEAGKLIVTNYASKAIDLLLPELQSGMFDENERIRLSSLQLTADLLFEVTGLSAKNEFEENDEEEAEGYTNTQNEINKQMLEVLGQERRDSVLSSLFVCRSDTSGIVRSAAVDVWKALVPNTPRTVKEILPVLTNVIVSNLASSSVTLRSIAAQTLGDMVRRVGGDVMSRLLPTLEASLEESTDSNSRQGVCIALHELIESSSMQLLAEYNDVIVNILKTTLVDGDANVREASAFGFDSFQTAVGKSAIDDIIPSLLAQLGENKGTEESENALLALQEIMATKSEIIFPILVPTLMEQPIDAFKSNALGSLAEVAGSALYKRLSVIINSIIDSLVSIDPKNADRPEILNSLSRIILSVRDGEGLHPLLQQLLALVKNEDSGKRAVVLQILPRFFESTVLNYSTYTPDFLQHLILSLDDDDINTVKDSLASLTALVKKQDKSYLEELVKPTKQALDLTGKPGKDIAGFKLMKGPAAILPIFLQGLMYGNNEQRELSAIGITSLVSKTPAANLKMYVTQIVGPLIRVVGERFNSEIKAAILSALNILFVKVPQFLRPFVPQLQRTFVRGLGDLSSTVLRERAALGLGLLIQYQPKVDPLVSELVTNSKNSVDIGVKTAMLKGLMEVISKVGKKLNESSKRQVINLVEDELNNEDKSLNIAYARLIGFVSEILTEEEAAIILQDKVFKYANFGQIDEETEETIVYPEAALEFACLTVNAFLKNSPRHVFKLQEEFAIFITKMNEQSKYAQVFDYALSAIAKILLLVGETKSSYTTLVTDIEDGEPFDLEAGILNKLVQQLIKDLIVPASTSASSRRLALVILRTLGRHKYDLIIKPNIELLVPQVFSSVRSSIIPIKLAGEKAFLQIFDLVNDEEQSCYKSWLKSVEGKENIENLAGDSFSLRSITEYHKRVALRLAASERERIESGGDNENVYSDEIEDEREIWAIGGVDIKIEE
ncbi:hypothetical protein QEN19_002112 [Hanseniaspora menglaensis]